MLEIENLSVSAKNGQTILQEISLSLAPGVCLGLTGASGSGKTTLIRSILGLDEGLVVKSGRLLLDGENLFACSRAERRAFCGRTIGFIPQNPMTAFFPHATIARQMQETVMLHHFCDKRQARDICADALQRVHLSDTARVLAARPSELSGGMLQRVAMALVLAVQPRYLLADEPTSALDAANREQLLALFEAYRAHAAILLVSHDTVCLRSLCAEIVVMEQGRISERQETSALFAAPQTDWTKRFVQAAQAQEKGESTWKAWS